MLLNILLGRVRRNLTLVGVAFVFSTLALLLFASAFREHTSDILAHPWTTKLTDRPPEKPGANNTTAQRRIHILLPATQSNVNLCKTLLTMTILGYPNPHIVAWQDHDKEGGLIGGGSHFAKITRTLDYINDPERRKQPGFDDELVFMLDAYDIWFQLPLDILLSRYDGILAEENARVAHRMGRAYTRDGIRSKVVFGAGKRCAPNFVHSVSCYPVPESPLPDDVYGGITDTVIGTNIWSSFRTRYLNSGYLIGPIGEMRHVLEKAKEKLDQCVNRKGASFDDGTGGSDLCYRGSDQSVFVEMFGEQEFHREVMRRHHRNRVDNWLDKIVSGRPGSKPPPTQIMSAPVLDRLNPGFIHQWFNSTYLPEKPYEFGIALDYWSLLGHQTSNALTDARYIRHDRPLKPQVGKPADIFQCKAKAPMPKDLPRGQLNLLVHNEPNRWETMPLYTEICVGTVPVMIHHNSVEKHHREKQWSQTWWAGRARALFEERRKAGAPQLKDGIPTDKGEVMKWEELCPASVEPELFRDVKEEKPGKKPEKKPENQAPPPNAAPPPPPPPPNQPPPNQPPPNQPPPNQPPPNQPPPNQPPPNQPPPNQPPPNQPPAKQPPPPSQGQPPNQAPPPNKPPPTQEPPLSPQNHGQPPNQEQHPKR